MTPYFWALLTALTWGCVPLIEKIGLAKLPPMIGLFYRSLGIIIGIAVLLIVKGEAIRSSFKEIHSGMFFLILGGFMASFIGQIFFYHSLKSGDASKVVPIGATYPLISFLLGILFLGEKFTLAKGGGMALIILGVVLLK
ncbi:MAG: EamA family transporter [Candidatus Omnitrophica bacterium]|nr:EamA family transporter [Candidatus Omnitrophota bacterium]